jgi:glycosyltransferase involved in cell wall biosynthesis
MRVLHFNQYGTHAGGVEGYISDVSVALGQAGHPASLAYFTPHAGKDLLPDSVCVPVEVATKPSTKVFDQLQRAVDDLEPDIAFLHAVYQPEVVRWIVDRLPAIAYVHGPYLVCPGSAQYWRTSQRTCERAAALGCLRYAQTERCCFGRNPIRHVQQLLHVKGLLATYRDLDILVGSRFMRRLLTLNGLPEEQIRILPPLMFDGVAESSTPEAGTVLFAGRIVPEKGLHLLIEALTQIQPTWRLIVAGEGGDQVRCQRLARNLGVGNQIQFLGWQDAAGMAHLYRRSAVVAVPSSWPEPYGRIGPEAFYYGRPVVAFDVGGVSDWLEHGVTGSLIPPGDVQAFGRALAHWLTPSLAEHGMGSQVQEQARGLWSTSEHLKNLLPRFEHVRASARESEAGR